MFKKIRGIAGFIGDAIEGLEVIITGPKGFVIVTTDADGFYGYAFHHKGKQFEYIVAPDGISPVTVQLKAGRFAEVNFP